MLTNNKVLTPVLTVILLAVGFFQTSISDGVFTDVEKWQLAALVVGAFITYIAPLSTGPWPGIFKVGGAVVGAVLATIIGFVNTGTVFDTNTITIVILAALNAFAAQTGTDARVDDQKAIQADPNLLNEVGAAVDPKAAEVARQTV